MALDYATFASPAFDANDYANAILAGEPYSINPKKSANSASKQAANEGSREDISVALAKLSFGIEDVSKQLKSVVNLHHEALLNQAASVHQLEGSLHSVQGGLAEISHSIERLRQKIRNPYDILSGHVIRLQKLQVASDVLRRTARFVLLARRLEIQMTEIKRSTVVVNGKSKSGKATTPSSLEGAEGEKERTLIKAALSVAEIFDLIESTSEQIPGASLEENMRTDEGQTMALSESDIPPISLRNINAVKRHLPAVEVAREQVTNEMENMLVIGIQELDQSLLASALQTAYNLRILAETIQSFVSDLTEDVETRIRRVFDMSTLAKDANIKEQTSSPNLLYKSRIRTEPTNLTAPQYNQALWTRLEALIDDLTQCCIKVYTLEKVLKIKRDVVSNVVFMEEAMKVLENTPSATFWSTLARALEKQCREPGKSSTFLQQTLTAGYPRFLRLFHDFFARIAVHTDTIYSQSYQSPETVITLRAVSNFEGLYLSRSTNRLNEAVGTAFAGAGRAPPSAPEGIGIARVVANELDTAKFDPLLVRSVAKNIGSSLELMLSRVDALVVRDRSATTLIGPTATTQQFLNSQLVTTLYHCWLRLSKLPEEYPEGVTKFLNPPITAIQASYVRIADPLLNAIRLEMSAIISRVHRVDFSDGMDTMARGMGGPSSYLKDLAEKIGFIRTEILGKFNVGELGQTWVINITRHVLRTFVLHVSIVKPLGENGKLQLTTDMTELEFALNSLLADGASSSQGSAKQRLKLDVLGADYRAVRALRPLLFLEDKSLAVPEETAGVPPLIVLHHILVRSATLPLPHKLHGWQESQYIRFVEEHTDEEVWSVIEQGLKHWHSTQMVELEDMSEKAKSEKLRELKEGEAFVELARKVLENARANVVVL